MTDHTTPAVANGNGGALVQRSAFATKQFDLWNLAKGLCQSDLVPQQFRNKPANCFLALQMAERMDLDMFAVMSNLYVVHGTPAFSAKFLIGLANMRGPFKGPLRFRTQEKPLAVTCYGTLKESNEDVSVTVSMAQADTAGWSKNGKYREVPQQMLSYRAATFLVRLYCPEVALMGARTVDEVEDMHAAGVGQQADYRDSTQVRSDPLSLELGKNIEAPQASRVVGEAEAETGAAERAARSGSSPDQLFGDTEAARED
jgi:hypothetical protein